MASSVNLSVIRGDDFEQQFQLTTCDQDSPVSYPTGIITGPTVIDGATFTPIDLTTSTILSQIRKTTGYQEQLLTTFSINMIDAVNGHFSIVLTNAQTLSIATNDQSVLRYDIQVTDEFGKIKTYVIGVVNITLDVSRAP